MRGGRAPGDAFISFRIKYKLQNRREPSLMLYITPFQARPPARNVQHKCHCKNVLISAYQDNFNVRRNRRGGEKADE